MARYSKMQTDKPTNRQEEDDKEEKGEEDEEEIQQVT